LSSFFDSSFVGGNLRVHLIKLGGLAVDGSTRIGSSLITFDFDTTSTTKERSYRIIGAGESITLRYTISENGLAARLLLLLWVSWWQVAVSASGQGRMMHRIFFLVGVIEHASRLAH